MKTQLRKFELIKRIINMDSFYAISIYDYGITLQGKYKADLAKQLTTLRFKSSLSINGYVEFQRRNLVITLTD